MVATQDIEDCLRILARLCDTYGEPYWATFDLFEQELAKRNRLTARINAYTSRPIHEETQNTSAPISPIIRPKI